MRQVAVDAYVRGPQASAADVGGDSLSDMVLREHLLETAVGRTTDLADQLRKLATLRDEGILSDEEFAAQKAKLLGT